MFADNKKVLTEAFGQGRRIWNGNFADGQTLPPVPRGHVVHIYENASSWRGHWMVSNGDGTACGCNNNNEDPPVERVYCPTLSLNKQFLDYHGGRAEVIDPTQIPYRN